MRDVRLLQAADADLYVGRPHERAGDRLRCVAVSWNVQMPRAIDSMSVIDCGVRITSVWSTVRILQHGLQRGRYNGRRGRRRSRRRGSSDWPWPAAHRACFSMVSSPSRGTDSPQRMAASVAITPGPPALVTIAKRLPAGRGW